MSKHALVKFCSWILTLLLAVIIAAHLGRSAVKGQESTAIILAATCVIFAIFFKLGLQKSGEVKRKAFIPWTSLPILGLAIWAANTRLFGKFDVGATLFHMGHSIKYDGLKEDIAEFVLFGILAILLILCVRFLGQRDYRVRWLDKAAILPLIFINPIMVFIYDSHLNPNLKNVSLLSYYAQPELVPPDEQPKNIVILYLESIEDTYSSEAFGDAFESLNTISQQGLRLKDVKEIQDTGWTIAGITSSQCGIPLLSYGLIMKNRMKNIENFLPGTKCLAEVLKTAGYKTVYYGAADLNFAGKGTFLKTHGYDDIRGTEQFPYQVHGELAEWGLHDDRLLDLALSRMEEMDKNEAPYLLSILTLAGHFPKGYPSPSCYNAIEGAQQMDSILLSIKCTGYLTQRFLKIAKEKGLLDDTVIVLLSDHLAHRNTQHKILSKLDRQNFVVIISPEISPDVKTVNAGMIDMYPTILEAAGYKIDNKRVGLGVSLLGNTPSLRGELGATNLDKLILRDKDLRRKVWELDTNN